MHSIDNNYNIVLASSSPRRKQLLGRIGLDFEVRVPNIDESSVLGNGGDIVGELSAMKANAVPLEANEIVIAADTVVVLDGSILGKPDNKDNAFHMLKSLSGKKHTVFTGLTVGKLIGGERRLVTEICETSVFFRDISDNEILDYIATGEPMDKAGAYGIQGKGAVFVERIDGDYYNVVGLPLCTLWENLQTVKGL